MFIKDAEAEVEMLLGEGYFEVRIARTYDYLDRMYPLTIIRMPRKIKTTAIMLN
jgi:hypothetical protein